MKFTAELFFLCMFCLNFYLIGRGKLTFLIVSSVIYLFISDYVFYILGYGIGEFSIGKLYIELLFISLFLFFIIELSFNNLKLNPSDLKMLLFLVFSLVLLAYGAFLNGVMNAVNGWRSIFLYIFLSWLTVRNIYDPDALIRTFLVTITAVAFINSIFSIYEYYTFSGDYTSVWRYDLLLEAKTIKNSEFDEHFLQYQLVRGEKLRSSGFFVSALSSGFFTALAAIILTNSIINNKLGIKSIMLVFLLLCFLVSMYTSQVRTAYIIYFLAIIIALFFKNKKFHLKYFYLYVLGIPVFILLAGIVMQSSLDASSAGRILQYKFLFENVSLLGQGLGANVGRFDSFYVYSFIELGFFAIILFLFFVSWFNFFPIRGAEHLNLESNGYPLLQAIFVTFFPVLAVQHIASSLYYFIITILVLLITKCAKKGGGFG